MIVLQMYINLKKKKNIDKFIMFITVEMSLQSVKRVR